jgi:tape measure domain-containing protein
MATRDEIIQYIYELKDRVTGKLRAIVGASKAQADQADKTADEVQRSNDRIRQSYDGVGGAIGKLRGLLAGLGIAVGLNEAKDALISVLETGERFDDLGKKFNTAFGGLSEGAQALAKVREIADGVPQGFEDVANAAVELKRRGIDPLNGTLQALLDNAAANDQSMDDLGQVIDALGKASLKGEIGMRALVSLTELGVPVFQLLSQATGQSEAQIRELAESGELGASSIKLMVDELGKLRAGAAASEMGDLDAILRKLKDGFNDFLAEIAKAGVLDEFKLKLVEVKDTILEMGRDGTLKEWARSTSESLISVGSVLSAIAEKWRAFTGASTILAESLKLPFNSALKTITSAADGLTNGFTRITGAGADVAAQARAINQEMDQRLSASLRNAADGARDLGGAFGDTAEEGRGLASAFADVEAGSASTADAWADVQSGAESTATMLEDLGNKAEGAAKKAGALPASLDLPAKPPGLEAAADGLQKVAEKSDESRASLQSARADTQAASDSLEELGGAAEQSAGQVGNAAKFIQDTYAGFANELGKTSAAAVERFTQLTREIFELSIGIADFSGLARFGKAAEDAYAIVNAEIAKQKGEVAGLAQSYTELSDAAIQNMIRTRGGVDNLATGLADIAQAAREGRSEFDLLGAQDLSGLASAADAAADRVRAIGEAAKEAREQLQGIADSLQDELDRAAGRNADIENRRYEKQLEDIRRLAEESGTLNTAEYNAAIARAKAVHELNLRNLAEEKRARDDAKKESQRRDEERAGNDSDSGSGGGGSSGASRRPDSSGSSQGASRTGGGSTYTLTFNVNGSTADVAREVKRQLDEIQRRSR